MYHLTESIQRLSFKPITEPSQPITEPSQANH